MSEILIFTNAVRRGMAAVLWRVFAVEQQSGAAL